MTAEIIERARAEAMLAAMAGAHAWGARVSADAVLRMDFGAPRLRIREPSPRAQEHSGNVRAVLERRLAIPTGRWHLFVEAGDWRVQVKAEACDRRDAESTDPAVQTQVTRCLSSLDGQIFRDAAWIDGAWRFRFDLGGVLTIADRSDDGGFEDDWTLFHEDGAILCWLRDHRFALDHSQDRG